MTNYVTLDNVKHADLKVLHQYGAPFGSAVNQVRVFITEFENLQREYPIFFRKTEDGSFYAISILGLDPEENLFLNETTWTGRYVPAALRRGPFKIGMTKRGQETVANITINLNDPRVRTDSGHALFEPGGGLSSYLKQMSQTLKIISVGLDKEVEFFSEIHKMSLVESVIIKLEINDELGYTIPDVYTISKAKILDLAKDDLAKMHHSGILELCYWVMSSMGNTNNLLERKLLQARQENS